MRTNASGMAEQAGDSASLELLARLGRRPLLSLLPLGLARRTRRNGDSGHGSAR